MIALLDTIYFLLRYVPFWAIPLMLIFLQFAYLYWLKDIRKLTYCLVIAAGLCFLIVAFYVYAGGPEEVISLFNSLIGVIIN